MSPFLKAVGIGITVFAASILIMYGVSRAMNRQFLPRFPQAPAATEAPIVQPTFPF